MAITKRRTPANLLSTTLDRHPVVVYVLSAVVAFAVVRCIWRFSFYLDDVTKKRKCKARP